MAPPVVRELIRHYEATGRGDAQTRALASIGKHFGGLCPGRIGPAELAAYRRARGVSDSTLRRELGALLAVLHWSERARLITHADVPYIELPPSGQARQLYMNETEAERFLTHAAQVPRVGAFVALALLTGARKEAIRGLTWDRVDLDAGTVDYRAPGLALSKKRRVAVPINARLSGILGALPRGPGPYVVGSGSLRSNYERFTRGMGMEWVTPHVMRHTAATLMLRSGVPVWAVAGVLGDTVQTITKTYAHHNTEHLRDAVANLGKSRYDRTEENRY